MLFRVLVQKATTLENLLNKQHKCVLLQLEVRTFSPVPDRLHGIKERQGKDNGIAELLNAGLTIELIGEGLKNWVQ